MATVPNTTRHPDYDKMLPEVTKVRDAVQGAFFVKRKGFLYLPHPSDVDQTSKAALARYDSYRLGAEFDEVPGITMRNMIGRAELQKSNIELPTEIDYLKENVDNDGTPMLSQIEQVLAELLQMKFCVLLAEYVNAPNSAVTPEERESMGVRSASKLYVRESIIDWDFRRINGVMQLSYMKLHEKRMRLDVTTGTRTEFDEYLNLALDEAGLYYWWRNTLDATGRPMETERVYPTIENKPLRWIPLEIVQDIDSLAGKLPLELGFLSPIVDKVLHRYRVSAKYAEAIDSIPPTVNTSGWTSQAWELYQQMNGRDYVVVGKGTNSLPEGVTMDVISPSAQLEHFVTYKEQNASEIRALGGEFSGDETAGKSNTQSGNESADKAAKALGMINNIERAYKRIALYCGMYEGIYKQSDIESNMDDIQISLNKEFAKGGPNVPLGQFIVNDLKMSGLTTDLQLVKMLHKAGFGDDAQELIDAMDGGE